MLTDLLLRDFRCFDECRVTLHPEMTVFVGRNAQGKTSLMEAACVLLRLQSPRTSNRAEVIRLGAKTMLIEGTLKDKKLRCAQSATVRRLAVDGAVCGKSAEYLSQSGLVVWMDHRDMNLLRGSAEHRRRYLDFAASQMFPDYLKALRGYERALRGRNHVLKRDAVIGWRQADAFAKVMDEFARVIITRRHELTQMLQPHVTRIHAELSGGSERGITNYAPSFFGASLFKALGEKRDEEQRLRQTALGPHRDDLHLLLNDLDATSYASEGQQRSLALSLKIAQAHALEQVGGSPPLLLLDDVFGELDAHRRRALLRLLPTGTQKVITTTNLEWAQGEVVPGRVYEVEGARVQKAGGE
ncbi:DNA replication and repair protein RecF [Prosthecobacter fusiformis]|uniref:DNA replication and repair protein RecF n=1 Tax=Prosthecobacter fusiformis TaxID=48464 RepID=A0A4R7RP10_9BACT|nr:DNA replication and repair protein RecF [Prosthecobacter fusiformis]TDU67162.1 DNA replication and repair protein RecF [Prosthecobacter fusiformis]